MAASSEALPYFGTWGGSREGVHRLVHRESLERMCSYGTYESRRRAARRPKNIKKTDAFQAWIQAYSQNNRWRRVFINSFVNTGLFKNLFVNTGLFTNSPVNTRIHKNIRECIRIHIHEYGRIYTWTHEYAKFVFIFMNTLYSYLYLWIRRTHKICECIRICIYEYEYAQLCSEWFFE